MLSKNRSMLSKVSQHLQKSGTPASSISFKRRAHPNQSEMQAASTLCELASTGDIAGLEQCLKKGLNLNAADYDFRTALHLASATGHKEAVEWLLSNGAEITVDRFGGLAIHDAFRNNHVEIAELLQQHPVVAEQFEFEAHLYKDQMETVFQLITKEGVFSFSLIAKEVEYYYMSLGLDSYYFESFTPPQIAKHIHSFIAAKKVAVIGRQNENIKLSINDTDQAFFLCTQQNVNEVEEQVETFLKQTSAAEKAYHLTSLQSKAPALPGGSQKLQIYIVNKANYENPDEVSSSDVYMTSTPNYLRMKTQNAIQRAQAMMTECMKTPVPVSQHFKDEEHGESVLMYAVQLGRPLKQEDSGIRHIFLKKLTQVFKDRNIPVYRKFIDSFSNGVCMYSFYTRGDIAQSDIEDINNYCSLTFTVPDNELMPLFLDGQISGRQVMYFYSAVRFVYYFFHQKFEDFDALYDHLSDEKAFQRKLVSLKTGLSKETISLNKIYTTVQNNLDICKKFYIDFARQLKEERPGYIYPDLDAELRQVRDPVDQDIIRTFRTFNNSILKTNFYKTHKSAIAFRLDPSVFLSGHKLPEVPFGIFMLSGLDFTGFHVRFRDISRGGVRMILSTPDNYAANRVTLFQENYGLAYTQLMKNKDIPEGGSKGTILIKKGRPYMAKHCVLQYVDSLMDLILLPDGVSNRYDRPEFIFLGPDENTADQMDVACTYAKGRDYAQWKSFTTGKSVTLGGIPHDTYGMTTRSVRAYVKGIQKKLNLKEEEQTKFMTGGPDGDLGSNEVTMSKEKIIAIVDGSGVLYDPTGIDRTALNSLAEHRLSIGNYEGNISPEGYLVRVEDKDIKLPNGEVIDSGIDLRNKFHLKQDITGDFFIPCGGRPESISVSNVHNMFKEDGTPRFKYVVEGANLFISAGAREILEDGGVILFKDASTNKGGVTSSSLEVLAALAMGDKDFAAHMQMDEDGVVPEFYKTYVEEICSIVERNATMEFEYIWEERKRSGKRNQELTDRLSENMNNLADIITESSLFDNMKVRRKVLEEYIPKTLQEKVGLDQILERVPEPYQKAIFSSWLASQYFYTYGAQSNVFLFYEFMKRYED